MLAEEDYALIRKSLDESENPLFLFDDDPDGLCSFLLLRSYTKKGIGLPIKMNPALDVEFLDLIKDYEYDSIFILDKPVVSQEFIDAFSVPVVWIDHHPAIQRRGVRYFNPQTKGEGAPICTTTLCYQAVKGPIWIAALGSVSDWIIPDYFEEFRKKYPDLVGAKKTVEEVLFTTPFGKLSRIFSFLIKGQVDEVKEHLSLLLKIKEPMDILDKKTEAGRLLYDRIQSIEKEYDRLLKAALEVSAEDKLLFFSYIDTNLSLTSDLSNELLYKRSGNLIIIAREKDGKLMLSLRSDIFSVREFLEDALKHVEGHGGGHKYACGAMISKQDLSKFLDIMRDHIKKAK